MSDASGARRERSEWFDCEREAKATRKQRERSESAVEACGAVRSLWSVIVVDKSAVVLAWQDRSLLLNVAKHVDGKAIDEPMSGSSGEVQRPEKRVGASGLLQATASSEL